MATVTVLGGCGAVGSVAARTLAQLPHFSEVVIADQDLARAERLAAALGNHASHAVAALPLDALDSGSVASAIAGSDVVLNCVGPFYNTVKPILAAVMAAHVNYVDVCDDVDVTLDLLEMDQQARDAGITALIGMGSSPGVTNIAARLAADTLLDSVDSVDIFHTHGGEPFEGEGVIAHRFHCMSIPIPMYLDGRLCYVNYFEPDGIALRQTFDFPMIGPAEIFPYPHPEQITIPRHIPLRRVTNKGSVLPAPYYNLTAELCRQGLSSREPLDVKGQPVVPHDFAVAYIQRERERILRQTGFGEQRGCVSVMVAGQKAGYRLECRFHMASTSQALGEGTGIPAAIGALLMLQGHVRGPGILPPEAGVDPQEFLAVAAAFLKQAAPGREGTMFMEVIDEQGNCRTTSLA